jgi:hypothetical protein
MARRLIAVFLLVAGALITSSRPSAQTTIDIPRDCVDRVANGSCLYMVSLVRLLAEPEQLDGQPVLVTGYIHFEFEGNAIYLHRDDLIYGITKDALWIRFAPGLKFANCQDRYVNIRGVFSARDTGHMGLFGGTIKDIDQCTPAKRVAPAHKRP